MKSVEYSNFKTAHEFYLSMVDNLLDRAKEVTNTAGSKNLARTGYLPFN